MSWRDLFERADDRETTVEDVRESVGRRRDGVEGEEGTEGESGS